MAAFAVGRSGGRPGKLYEDLTAKLVAFAEFEFELDKVVDGSTQREHLRGLWERTGVMPKTLANAPRCPAGLSYLWALFLRLRRRCTPSMGVSRILYSDMAAFQAVTGIRLSPWEADAIERLDDALVEARASK